MDTYYSPSLFRIIVLEANMARVCLVSSWKETWMNSDHPKDHDRKHAYLDGSTISVASSRKYSCPELNLVSNSHGMVVACKRRKRERHDSRTPSHQSACIKRAGIQYFSANKHSQIVFLFAVYGCQRVRIVFLVCPRDWTSHP